MNSRNRRRLGASSRSATKKWLGRNVLIVFILLLVLAGAAVGFILFETEKPQVTLDKDPLFLGSPLEVQLQASDRKSGIQQVAIVLRQNEKEFQLFKKSFPRRAWLSKAGAGEIQETLTLDVQQAGAKEGEAKLTVSVHDFSLNGDLQGNATIHVFPVTIDTKPPRVHIEHAQQYIMPGGSGIVVYSISEPSERHGVMLDDAFFQGYPLPDGKKRFIAYIALPWNSDKPEQMQVVAEDQAGNEGNSTFSIRFKPAKDKKDRINISDGFLNKKIPEFQESYPELTGTNLEKYLFVNNTVRIRNAEKIAALSSNTASEQLWQDRFLRMPGAGRAGFADQRTYYYQGEAIDHQTHLGMDIASTARVTVEAANRGKVVFADYLGIYGNMVMIDHGQGLTSLYSHLSRIAVEPGQLVEKGEIIGHSGTTGMAGGDHLHFSMLVHGIFVTPIEWWDQHWIDVNINNVIQ
ncbi:Peptidase family M23 [Candidatus Electrothrix marina]|uniref:Peptidase family M23 n=1 Tax=Candidatus Electrothrix marina TaxID=1859130 RepID=A0A444JER4_9BACT|nr:Peptidase family M23 [Candidatus Electrothrix marina]